MKQNPWVRVVAVLGSQAEVARRAGCSRQAVFEWKRTGSIPKFYATRLHNLTGIPLEDLLEDWDPVTGRVIPNPK